MKLKDKLKNLEEIFNCNNIDCKGITCANCPIMKLQKIDLKIEQVCEKCGQEIK